MFRRNPGGVRGFLGGAGSVVRDVGNIVAAEFTGDVAIRLLGKTGLTSKLQVSTGLTPFTTVSLLRVAVGLGIPFLFGLAGVRTGPFLRTFRTINVAAGVIGLTTPIRQQLLTATTLGDYEGAGAGSDRYEGSGGYLDDIPEPGVLGDWELAGEYDPTDPGFLGDDPYSDAA